MSLIDEYEFKKCVDRYKGDRHAIKFNCRDQFMVMSFAQFTDRSGLRDIETTLNLCGDLYRSGIKVMPKSTLAEANEKKDWRIYQDFAMTLVKEATLLYKDEKLRIGLEEMIYAFDSSTIELCLKLCPWAEFHHGKGAFKMHTLMDLRGSIPTFVLLTPGKVYHFLTNNFSIEDPLTIAELYRERWQIELFFKWIKQHLHIKTFYGTSQNAVYTQIWIAVCDYLLLIIAKKRYGLVPSLHSISNSIGQVLFRRADIRELYNQPTLPVNVPETEAVEQLTLW